MKSGRDYSDYLKDILDSIIKIERFVAGKSSKGFFKDDKTVFAVLRALEIIGEAAKKVPPSVRKQAPDIPWREMAGIRDKLIHEYFGVNLEVIWKTIEEDLPPLKSAIRRLVGRKG